MSSQAASSSRVASLAAVSQAYELKNVMISSFNVVRGKELLTFTFQRQDVTGTLTRAKVFRMVNGRRQLLPHIEFSNFLKRGEKGIIASLIGLLK